MRGLPSAIDPAAEHVQHDSTIDLAFPSGMFCVGVGRATSTASGSPCVHSILVQLCLYYTYPPLGL